MPTCSDGPFGSPRNPVAPPAPLAYRQVYCVAPVFGRSALGSIIVQPPEVFPTFDEALAYVQATQAGRTTPAHNLIYSVYQVAMPVIPLQFRRHTVHYAEHDADSNRYTDILLGRDEWGQ